MLIIEITAQSNGAHRNQTGTFRTIAEGWAEVPSSITIPDTFPFVDIEVDGQTVISMTAGIVPEPELEPEPTPAPTQIDRLESQITYTAMMTDTLIPEVIV